MTIPNINSPLQMPGYKINRIIKKSIWIFSGLLLFVGLGTFGLSYYVGWNLTHPVRKPVQTTPTSFGLAYQTIQFPSQIDHIQLKGWLIPAGHSTNRIVIFSHGYRENRSSEKQALPVAKALHDAGFAVLMFDYRDEGQSQGTEVSVGLNEEKDLLGAVDFAHQQGYSRAGVFGMSMGASTALETTAFNPDIVATVADSPFADLHSYLSQQMPVWTNLPNWPFTSEILFEMRVFGGLDARKVSPLTDLKQFKPRPILLIAGTRDHTISMENSIDIYNEIKQNKEDALWMIQGAGHIGGYDVAPKEYVNRIVQFFEDYLKK